MIQLHRSPYTTDRVAEILAGSAHNLDLRELQDFLRSANLTTQRIFGFLFERFGIDFEPELAQRARRGQASSRLTAASTAYNAKWRLYYDPALVECHLPF